MTLKENPALKYRPEIDGLRAIAILLVLLFHFFPQFCPGGFIGVDVFFVISGYLITSIIADKIKTSSFSFQDFYARRVRRLFPALILVFSVVFVWAWFNLVDCEFAAMGKHLLAGIFFVYNYVAKSEAGYFDVEAAYKLFHHLWSLAVEEQFYLIYPLILIGANWRRFSLSKTLVFLLVVSFILNVTQIIHVPTNVFYFPEYRLWELAAGGLLALQGSRIHQRFFNETLALLSLVLILVTAFILNESSLFPGYWALIPVLGTVAIVFCGPKTRVAMKLSYPWLTYVGRISYPLYLWHWPLYSISHYWKMDTLPYLGIELFFTSVVLAILTYECVEKKIQRLRNLSRVAWVCLFLMALIGVFAWSAKSGQLLTLHHLQTRRISAAMVRYDQPETNLKYKNFPLNFIAGKGPLASENVLLLGDSLAFQYYPRFESAYSQATSARNFYMLVGGGCPPIPGLHRSGDTYCGFIDSALDLVKEKNVRYVFITARWEDYFSDSGKYHFNDSKPGESQLERSISSLQQMIEEMTAAGAKVTLVQSNPIDDRLDPRSMIHRNWKGLFVEPKQVPLNDVKSAGSLSRKILSSVAAHTHSLCLDPLKVLCDEKICRSLDSEGNPLYRDARHLNPDFVKNLNFLDFLLFKADAALDPALACD